MVNQKGFRIFTIVRQGIAPDTTNNKTHTIMFLTINSLSEENLEKAFNNEGGFSYEDNPTVREAVNMKARMYIRELHAKRAGMTVEEYIESRK